MSIHDVNDAGGRDGIAELCNLAEFLRDRLVAHDGCIAEIKSGNVLLKPPFHSAAPPDYSARFVANEAVVEIALKIHNQTAETDCRLMGIRPMQPSIENLFTCRT